jgi:hypothetical protein
MDTPNPAANNERADELDRIDSALATVRDVADRASALTPGELRDALDDVMGRLWAGFAPHEETERRLADALGGRVPEIVRLNHRQIHRRLALLAGELRAPDENGPERARVVTRLLDALEALVAAQLEFERWMIQRRPTVDTGVSTHCEWCGAEYPIPGEE